MFTFVGNDTRRGVVENFSNIRTKNVGTSGYFFSDNIAIQGDIAVIGDASWSTDTGQVFVYTRSVVTGDWTLEATLTASDGQTDDSFGYAVAIDGDYIVVGAFDEDFAALDAAGAAYVFKRDATGSPIVWNEEAKLVPSDREESAVFGYRVAISGTTVAVGAYLDDGTGSSGAKRGAVYVFDRGIGSPLWTQTQKLIQSSPADNDWFGHSIAIDGDYLIAGAYVNADAAYVFKREGSPATWTEKQKLTETSGNYGYSVAIKGSTAMVSNPTHGTGKVYVYTRSGETWSLQHTLSGEGSGDRFGERFDLQTDFLAVAAPFQDTGGSNKGALYILTRGGSPEAWTQQFVFYGDDVGLANEDKLGGPGVRSTGNNTILAATVSLSKKVVFFQPQELGDF